MPERPVWPRLDAPLWLSELRARGSCLFDLPDGNCAARSTTHVRLPVLATPFLREREPSRSSSRCFSARGRDLSESPEFAVRSPERPTKAKTAGASRLIFACGKEAHLSCTARQSIVKSWKNILRSQSSTDSPAFPLARNSNRLFRLPYAAPCVGMIAGLRQRPGAPASFASGENWHWGRLDWRVSVEVR